MLSKNLKYYRLRKGLSKKALAEKCGVSPMMMTYYEQGQRKPSAEVLKAMAAALGVKVLDFLKAGNSSLVFRHGAFRAARSLGARQQELVRASVEEHFGRFFTAAEILGGEVLPPAPECHQQPLSEDAEENARRLRECLGFPLLGPLPGLIEALENRGVLVCLIDIGSSEFPGVNGFAGERPFIALNAAMGVERMRSTIAHELAHLMFRWPQVTSESDSKKAAKTADAIAGAFLMPGEDLKRELGLRRKAVTRDWTMVCREYGVSMALLVARARLAGVIGAAAARDFRMRAERTGCRQSGPQRARAGESPRLFERFVYRAVNEGLISVQKGAELLKAPYDEVAAHCGFDDFDAA
ncbi:MAG: helix-turn-helix domain-containing protein, partial [Duodenibacillus sp.]|nr:helix-turn-helix domain-containing protein [Duodenibacillus sp.]